MALRALTCIRMIKQVLGSRLDLRKLKMGFLSEKCQVPESTQFSARLASSLLAVGVTLFLNSP
jgi:hypothetical protein